MKDLIRKILDSVGVGNIKIRIVPDKKEDRAYPGWFLALAAILIIAVNFVGAVTPGTTIPVIVWHVIFIAFGFSVLIFGPVD